MNNGTFVFIVFSVVVSVISLILFWYRHARFMSKVMFECNMLILFSLTDSIAEIEKEYPQLCSVVQSFSRIDKGNINIDDIIPSLNEVKGSNLRTLDRELRKAINSDDDDVYMIAKWYMLAVLSLQIYRNPFKYHFLKFMFTLKKSNNIDKAVKKNFKNNEIGGLCVA